MAASIIVPARTRRGPREVVARAAARTAPQGQGLAVVVPLPTRTAVAGTAGGAAPHAVPLVVHDALTAPQRPALRVVAPSARPRTGLRIVASLLAGLLVLGAGATLLRTVLAAPTEPVAAGHVVLQPGETLWDVAVRSAPAGVDTRRQLDAIRRLNGFGPGTLDAWTVVLIPAP
jgi:Tfp pilus assembly protein FimV